MAWDGRAGFEERIAPPDVPAITERRSRRMVARRERAAPARSPVSRLVALSEWTSPA
jgi:hypothetical protein